MLYEVITPPDSRLAAYKGGAPDIALEEMLFQYARYLMISSSRPGAMPANLQGLWNNSNRPPVNAHIPMYAALSRSA